MELLPASDPNMNDPHVHPATELKEEKDVRKKERLTRRQLKFRELYNNIMGCKQLPMSPAQCPATGEQAVHQHGHTGSCQTPPLQQ